MYNPRQPQTQHHPGQGSDTMETKTLKNTIIVFTLLFALILFLEIAFRVITLDRGINIEMLRIILFSLAYSAVFIFFLRFLKPLAVKIGLAIILTGLTTFYVSQTLYFLVMDNFYSLSILTKAGVGMQFAERVFMNLEWSHIFFFVPLMLFIAFIFGAKKADRDFFEIRYRNYLMPAYTLILASLLMFTSVWSLSNQPISGDEEDYAYSEADLFDIFYSPRESINRFGLLTYAQIDLRQMAAPPADEEETTQEEQVRTFLEDRVAHDGNEFSELFEDKNLIIVMAESMDTFSIDKYLTPNLYDMKESAWYFEDYYAPPYYQYTADSEFMLQTSYFPTPDAEENLTMQHTLENTFPDSLPRLFQEKGYDTIAHHNYTDYFYPRSQFLSDTMGYDEYVDAFDMGLLEEGFDPEDYGEGQETNHPWPSDLKMMEATLPDLLEKEQFFAYYLGVSGHLPYSEAHPIAEKNYDTIKEIFEEKDTRFDENVEKLDEPSQESMYYFHAAHYEFDLAIGHLMDELEASGRDEDTVVLITSDHFAYGLSRGDIENYDKDKDFDLTNHNMHNLPFFLYHPSLDDRTVEGTKSTVDILPTVANLFGLELDYSRVLGRDFFNDGGNVALFVNNDFVGDRFIYDLSKRHSSIFRDPEDEENQDEAQKALDAKYEHLIHKREMSRYILNTDFFDREDDEEDDSE